MNKTLDEIKRIQEQVKILDKKKHPLLKRSNQLWRQFLKMREG